MWLLIKVDKQEDVNKNEKQRILIHDEQIKLKKFGYFPDVIIDATGINVHLMTEEEKWKKYMKSKY